MEYAVDIQGFKKSGNEFVAKELAVLPLGVDNEEPRVYLFKPPFPWCRLTEKYKRHNLWMEMCYHGLTWNSGEHSYGNIEQLIRESVKDASSIFVIGDAVKKFLECFNLQVFNLSDWRYPEFDPPIFTTDCPNHSHLFKAVCARQNVKSIEHFYKTEVDMDWNCDVNMGNGPSSDSGYSSSSSKKEDKKKILNENKEDNSLSQWKKYTQKFSTNSCNFPGSNGYKRL